MVYRHITELHSRVLGYTFYTLRIIKCINVNANSKDDAFVKLIKAAVNIFHMVLLSAATAAPLCKVAAAFYRSNNSTAFFMSANKLF